MSTLLNQFYSALSTQIGTVWSDVVDNGIFEADHVENISWNDMPPPPYAVIAIDTLPKEAGWGISNQVYAPNVFVYRVEEVKGPLSSIRTNLETLEESLLPPASPLAVGQVLDVSELTWSMMLPPNQIFVSKRMTHRAGRLTAKCLIGRVLGT